MPQEVLLSDIKSVTLEFNIVQIKVLRQLLSELPYDKVSFLIESFDKQVMPQLDAIRTELQTKFELEKVDEANAVTDSEN